MRIQKLCAFLVLVAFSYGAGLNDVDSADAAESDTAQDFFAAIDARQLEATFIPADAAVARVILRNLTNHNLDLKLPAAIAGVPVLAQFGNQQGQGAGQGQAQAGGGGQSVGAGMQGQGQGQGIGQGIGQGFGPQGGQVGGFMRIPPGKTMRMKLATVCLQHGKPEPNPRMQYRIVPIADFTNNAIIERLCTMLGPDDLNQSVAQAAAWHVIDGMSWESLAQKNQFESKYVGQIKFFTSGEIEQAKKLVTRLNDSLTLVSSGYETR
ncbi:hypothetical protein [Rubripirellula reticaptiva]|uniref:Uncharacterized protein n=1 Tax=Rubripirellula reticaptiva TaxID=2528013 RepID=A0A5C6FC77_9BACT|nr:hypothetical protein [Rubripirellula reticaptiva]TWU57904.1 hypothetical protein Poly59_08130 [Rubripirellula reticaptiva]